jgi:hypothetical protein
LSDDCRTNHDAARSVFHAAMHRPGTYSFVDKPGGSDDSRDAFRRPDRRVPSCAHCKAVDDADVRLFKACGRCGTVVYCSRDCQLAHWTEHKPKCKKPVT